jgi:anion-transporting  ArsA/GET3 family ATPase
MADFFSSRLLRWLTVPARSRVMNMATKPFYTVADRILGSQFLEDIAEFFLLFQTMYDGFVERARSVTHLLHDRRTTFIVVSTLESAPLHEAEFFIQTLRKMEFNLGALILNKVLPDYLTDPEACQTADRMLSRAPELAQKVAPEAGEPAQVARVLTEVAESFLRFGVVAKREAEQRAELAAVPDVVASVPYFDRDIYDLTGLLRLGNQIWS